MRQLTCTAPGRLAWRDVATPALRGGGAGGRASIRLASGAAAGSGSAARVGAHPAGPRGADALAVRRGRRRMAVCGAHRALRLRVRPVRVGSRAAWRLDLAASVAAIGG